MNISYRSRDWRERILSNFADTPFAIVIHGETFPCRSVEGFWQGLKCKGDRRLYVFQLSGLAAKNAGRGKRGDSFEIAGLRIRVGSDEHEALIREAIRQKVLQNPRVAEALRESTGVITHHVPGHSKPIFKMEKMLASIRRELWGH
jgi:hypothetical protein